MKKKIKKIIKILIVLVVLIILVVGGLFIYNKVFTNTKEAVKEAVQVDTIEGFDYVLYDNCTELYETLYYELKDVLESETIDYEEYAKLVSELFVADFYTLSNKVTNQDVGGLDFIYSENRDNFKEKAIDTLYNSVESNVYGDREQDLPEVSEITSIDITTEEYSYTSTDEDNPISISDSESYVVTLSWDYKEDLGYQTSATIRLVHEDDVLSIVSIE